MKRALLFGLVFCACMPRAARIPQKAATDMQCPEAQLQVLEVDNGGDTGQHLVMGCGKKAIYELNNMGEWVLHDVISKDTTHVKLPSDGETP